MEQLQVLVERIDTLSIRERAMILLAILAVIIFIWDSFFMAPLDARQSSIQSQLEVKRAENAALSMQVRQAIERQAEDPNAANRERIAQLRAEMAALEEAVRDIAADMIEPARMPEVLRTVISQVDALTLAQLKGLGTSPLMPVGVREESSSDSGEESNAVDAMPGFRHGMQIRVTGDYLTTLEYMRRLENLQWRFFWDKLEFDVIDYPHAEATLTIYTLSLSRDWIRA